MIDKRAAVKRANDLLQLAAPGSNTSDAERTSAALEAAKVVAANGLVVAEKPPPARRPRPAPKPAEDDGFFSRTRAGGWSAGRGPADHAGQDWVEARTPTAVFCGVCRRFIPAGERAWVAQKVGWRHYEIDCDQK